MKVKRVRREGGREGGGLVKIKCEIVLLSHVYI